MKNIIIILSILYYSTASAGYFNKPKSASIGSLQWIEAGAAPITAVDSVNNRIFSFVSSLSQNLYTSINVPDSYVPGKQIKMSLKFYSPDSSGTALLTAVSTLIRTGTDAITSTTNQRTSTNSAITLSGGTVNIPQSVIFDLTSSTGTINSVAVSAGSTILINLSRGSDTAASDLSSLIYNAEVITQ